MGVQFTALPTNVGIFNGLIHQRVVLFTGVNGEFLLVYRLWLS
jgi:hypothetical protein